MTENISYLDNFALFCLSVQLEHYLRIHSKNIYYFSFKYTKETKVHANTRLLYFNVISNLHIDSLLIE